MSNAVIPILGAEKKVLTTDEEIIEYLVTFTISTPARSMTGGIWDSSMVSLDEVLAQYGADSLEMALDDYSNKLQNIIRDHIPNSAYVVVMSHTTDGIEITIKLSVINEATGENVLSMTTGYPL